MVRSTEERIDAALDEVRAILRAQEDRHAHEVAKLKDALFKIETLAHQCADNRVALAIYEVLKTVLR